MIATKQQNSSQTGIMRGFRIGGRSPERTSTKTKTSEPKTWVVGPGTLAGRKDLVGPEDLDPRRPGTRFGKASARLHS
jgi:hypothetical protein